MIVVLSISDDAGGSCNLTITLVLANENPRCLVIVSDVKYKPDLKEGKQMASRKKLTVQGE